MGEKWGKSWEKVGKKLGKSGEKGGKGGKRDGTWVNFRNFGHFCIGGGGAQKIPIFKMPLPLILDLAPTPRKKSRIYPSPNLISEYAPVRAIRGVRGT